MNERPNIILINCDDLGYGDLGCYGSTKNKTPAIDKLAQEGVRLTDFYMASALCSPSRGGMMTGCYPPRIGFGEFEGKWVLFPGQGVGLNPNEKTIAAVLKDAGYSTMLIGKWHCGDQPEFLPLNHGFDSYYGLPYSNDMGRQVNRTHFPPLPLIKDMDVIEQQPDQKSITERYVEQAVWFLRKNKDRPFFLYMAHMHVHLPLYAPDRFVNQSHNGNYGACVECIDWSVNAIVNELEQLGIKDNTLIVFTSDNGSRGDNGASNAPLRGKKATTWEGGFRVPCIMYWNGHIKPGQVLNGIVSSLDFYKTFARLAEAVVPENIINDSFDVSDYMMGNKDESPRETFFFYYMNSLEAVRHRNYKLHVQKNKESVLELYDLESDISETKNVAEDFPDVVAQLNMLMDECRYDIGDSLKGIDGKNVRQKGVINNPKPLTVYREDYPYIEPMYDRDEIG